MFYKDIFRKPNICIMVYIMLNFSSVPLNAQYASPDPDSPFYDSQGNQISIGQAMDQGGTVRVHKAPEKTKVNTAELFAGGWKLLREIVPKECKDCSEWHKDKERRLKICQDLYRECLKRQDDMWFWGDVALNVKYGTLIAIGLLSSKVPVPGVVNIVNMGFDIADTGFNEDVVESAVTGFAQDTLVDNALEDMKMTPQRKHLEKKAKDYKKILAANKYPKTKRSARAYSSAARKLKAIGKNVGEATPYINVGITTVEYGIERRSLENKMKIIEDSNSIIVDCIDTIVKLRCPECGGL